MKEGKSDLPLQTPPTTPGKCKGVLHVATQTRATPPGPNKTNNSRGGKNEVGKEEGKKSHHLLLFFQILFFFLKSSTGIAREGQDLFTWEIFPFLPAPEVQNGNEGKWGNPLWEGVGQQFSLISPGFLPRTPPAPSISHVPTCLLTC